MQSLMINIVMLMKKNCGGLLTINNGRCFVTSHNIYCVLVINQHVLTPNSSTSAACSVALSFKLCT